MRAVAVAASILVSLLAGSAQAASAPKTVLHIGDSLAYGTAVYLKDYLRGWRLTEDIEVSMQSYSVPGRVAAQGASLPRVLLVSAGTNGHPAAIAQFRSDVRKVLRLAGPRRCVVWANVVRPPYQGVSYDGINRALADLDRRTRNLLVLDWAGMVRRNRWALSEDGVHVAVPFYRKRAQALASLAKRCPS